MGRVLGIDYGLKRVGIAVTDPFRIICKPLIVIENARLMEWLDTYMKEEDVDVIVLGMPLRLNGEDSHITQNVIAFEQELRTKYSQIEIATVDERLTSKMAKQSLIDSGVPKQKRREKGVLDSVSASLILQTYIEKLR